MKKIIHNLPSYIDYNWLMHNLKDYASPRAKVTSLLRKGHIIRVKKGLYIPGPDYDRNYSKGVLANRIYGPSYVSFEYALYWYNLIPERAYSVTSACVKRNKQFKTPVGLFMYTRVKPHMVYAGIDIAEESGVRFIIATPQKALCDMVNRNRTITDLSSLESYLYSDLRLDDDKVSALEMDKMRSVAHIYNNKRVSLLYDFLRLRKKYE